MATIDTVPLLVSSLVGAGGIAAIITAMVGWRRVTAEAVKLRAEGQKIEVSHKIDLLGGADKALKIYEAQIAMFGVRFDEMSKKITEMDAMIHSQTQQLVQQQLEINAQKVEIEEQKIEIRNLHMENQSLRKRLEREEARNTP